MKHYLIALCLWTSALFVFSQQEVIDLPTAVKTGGMPLMEALNKRQSDRSFSSKDIDRQTLSNMLWAANGFNRDEKRTVATSQNKQEMEVYVIFRNDAYWYDAKENKLKLQVGGDVRGGLGQPNVSNSAALNLVYVADLSKATDSDAAYIDTGFMSQNVYLFCAANGLGTVVRTSFQKAELSNALKLKENQQITLVQAVGYIK